MTLSGEGVQELGRVGVVLDELATVVLEALGRLRVRPEVVGVRGVAGRVYDKLLAPLCHQQEVATAIPEPVPYTALGVLLVVLLLLLLVLMLSSSCGGRRRSACELLFRIR